MNNQQDLLQQAIDLLNKYWTFDNDQQHTHSWHDKNECMKLIENLQQQNNEQPKPNMETPPFTSLEEIVNKFDNIDYREYKYVLNDLRAILNRINQSISDGYVLVKKEENKFTVEEIMRKLEKLHPTMLDDKYTNPFVFKGIEVWYEELKSNQK